MKKIIITFILMFSILPSFAQLVELAPELNEEIEQLNFNDKDVMDKLSEYFLRGADIGRSFQYGETLLMRACTANHLPAAKYLLEKGLDPNAQFDDGSGNCLTIAIREQNPAMVRLLLEKGADVNINMNNTSVLHEACFFQESERRNEIITMLISAKADINKLNTAGYTPLIVAILNGNKNYVKILIAAGADVNLSQASDGTTSLKLALKSKNKDIITMLKKAGAK